MHTSLKIVHEIFFKAPRLDRHPLIKSMAMTFMFYVTFYGNFFFVKIVKFNLYVLRETDISVYTNSFNCLSIHIDVMIL